MPFARSRRALSRSDPFAPFVPWTGANFLQQTHFAGWIDQQVETAPVINVFTDVTIPHDIATLVLANGDLLAFQIEFEVDSTIVPAAATVNARLYVGATLLMALTLPDTIADSPAKYSLLFLLQVTPTTVRNTRAKTQAWIDDTAYNTLADSLSTAPRSGELKLQLQVNQLGVEVNVFQSIITRVRPGL